MNWYKKATKYYGDEDMMEYMNALLAEEMEGSDLTPYERIEIQERLENMLSSFPPGYKLKKDDRGWTVLSPGGHGVSLNEEQLMHSIPGGKARLDFMGETI